MGDSDLTQPETESGNDEPLPATAQAEPSDLNALLTLDRPHRVLSLGELDPDVQLFLQRIFWGQPDFQQSGHLYLDSSQYELRAAESSWLPLQVLCSWLSYRSQPLYGMAFEHADYIDGPLAQCPALAQSCFDLAIMKVRWMQGELGGKTRQALQAEWKAYYQAADRDTQTPPTDAWKDVPPELRKHDYFVALLTLGRHAWVDISQGLPTLVALLRSPFKEHRESALRSLWSALLDGRLSLDTLARALAQGFAAGSQGLKYLLESLEIMRLKGPVGEALSVEMLDLLWAEFADGLKGRVLAASLDLGFLCFQQVGRVPDRKAAEQLRNWAQAKKKSVSQDKARIILDLGASDSQPSARYRQQALCQQMQLESAILL